MHAILLYPLILALFLALTVVSLLALSSLLSSPPLAFYARSIASFCALILCAAYGTIASALLNVVGYGGLGQWTTARAFKWTMWVFVGVWIEIEDEGGWLNRTRPAVLLGNHQTELDVLILGHIFPMWCSVTAKASLKWWPVLGWFMSLSKTVFIQRSSRTQAVAAFAAAAEQMHSHRQSVYIFPEGTRSYATQPFLLPFKKGAFHLAVQAQVPIIPVVAENYSHVLNVKARVFRPGTIRVKVLEPIPTVGVAKEGVDGLLELTRERMLEAVKEISGNGDKEEGNGVVGKSSAVQR